MSDYEIGATYQALANKVRDKIVVIESSRGAGKTRAVLCIIVARAMRNPGTRWLLARSTRTRLSESVLATLEEQVLPMFGIRVPAGNRVNRIDYPIGNGSVLVPQGMDDPQRSQSAEYAGIYVSEAVELDRIEDFTALLGSMRQQGVDYHQLIADCNPGAPAHWLNQACEDVSPSLRRINTMEDYRNLLIHNVRPAKGGKWKRMIATWADNPAYFDVGKWNFTKVGQDYIDTLKMLSGHMRRRWLDGDWVAATGSVFPEFSEELHVCDDFEPPPSWPSICLWDPGYGTTAILWMTIAPDGGIYVYDEIYEGQKSVETHMLEVRRRNKKYDRNVSMYYADCNEAFSNRSQGLSVALQAMQYGFRWSPWIRCQGPGLNAQVEGVRHCLKNTHAETFPYLKVCRRCKGLISNMENWAYKTHASGDLAVGDDAYEKGNDHAADCVRSGIAVGYLQKMWKQDRDQFPTELSY